VAYYDWSDAYIGFNAGGVWYDEDRTFRNAGALAGVANRGTNGSDGIFGFHAGAQWQWGAWVLGAEAALSGCFRECRNNTGTLPIAAGIVAANTFNESKITNLFTVGPRLGYAWDRWMIFATGGYASADLKSTNCSAVTGICGPAFSNVNGASRNNGWYAGGGFDYMVHKGPLVDVLLGVEYHTSTSARTMPSVSIRVAVSETQATSISAPRATSCVRA
jgi:outer membrane immunogenic protein